MLNMIKADFYRLFRSKMAYIVVTSLLLLSALAIWQKTPGASVFSSGSEVIVEEAPNDNAQNLSDSLDAIQNPTETMSQVTKLDKKILEKNINLYYIFIFLVGVIVVQDFSFKSIKNSLTSAISRKTYFISKVVTSLIVCLTVAFGHTLFVYLLNGLLNGAPESSSLVELLRSTLYQTPYFIGLIGLLMVAIFTLQKAASFYGFSIAVLVVITVSLLFLQLSGLANVVNILSLEPQTALGIVVGNPDWNYFSKYLLVGFGSFAIFTSIGYIRFNRTEIH